MTTGSFVIGEDQKEGQHKFRNMCAYVFAYDLCHVWRIDCMHVCTYMYVCSVRACVLHRHIDIYIIERSRQSLGVNVEMLPCLLWVA